MHITKFSFELVLIIFSPVRIDIFHRTLCEVDKNIKNKRVVACSLILQTKFGQYFLEDDVEARAYRLPGAFRFILNLIFVISDPENPRVTVLNA